VDQPNPAVVVVCVVGAIDLLTAPALHDHLDRLLTAGPHRVVIDLSQVSLLGAAGLSALVSVQRAATQQGTTVQLRAPTRPAAAQSLTITGLDGLFEIVAGTDRDQPPAASAALLH
jgi:anti-sigma B factor antagonist